MAAFDLQTHVFAAEADGGVIFLDLKADRYLALTRERSRSFAAALSGDRSLDPELARHLADAGLLTACGTGKGLAFTKAAAASAELTQKKRARPWTAGLAMAARMRARALLGRKRLEEIVSARRRFRCRHAGHAAGPDKVLARAAAFAATEPLSATHNACLAEALALILFLGPAGAEADWVFAVTGAPFTAHCWVQLGTCVLNDSLDHVRPFTPIMVA